MALKPKEKIKTGIKKQKFARSPGAPFSRTKTSRSETPQDR